MSWSHDYWMDRAEIEAVEAGVPLGQAIESVPHIQHEECCNETDREAQFCAGMVENDSRVRRITLALRGAI